MLSQLFGLCRSLRRAGRQTPLGSPVAHSTAVQLELIQGAAFVYFVFVYSANQCAPATERRCGTMPTLNANDKDTERLISMWESKDPTQAHAALSLDDVYVTNASDKETQLPKILNEAC